MEKLFDFSIIDEIDLNNQQDLIALESLDEHRRHLVPACES